MKDKVDTDIKNMGLGSNVKTQIDDQGLVIRLSTDEVVFPSASAALTPTATNFLMALSGMLRNTANEIKVEGHCDNVPIAPGYIYATNWELSTARASAVIRYFIEAAGLDATRMTAAGYADTRPRVPNDTPEHRAMNRRVEILISPLTQNKKTSSDSTSASSSSSSGESTSKGAKTTKSTQATKKESTKKK
jgi:chemotaxis protein MotB